MRLIRFLSNGRTVLYLLAFFALAGGVSWLSVMREDAGRIKLSGPARVSDGDSLVVEGQRVRLIGIDAPELDQQCTLDGRPYDCGYRSRDHLRQLIDDAAVACEGDAYDKYARILAVCRVVDVDLNRRMVADGWAVAYGRYSAQERQAENAGAGLWRGEFDRPKSWRSGLPEKSKWYEFWR